MEALGDDLALGRLARTIRAPHFLEIVELAHVGAENVDDRVAGVEQHPVAKRQAFDPGRGKPASRQALTTRSAMAPT